MFIHGNESYSTVHEDRDPASTDLSLSGLLLAVRRQLWPTVFICGAFLMLGLVYVVKATPLYTARALLLIENPPIRGVADIAAFAIAGNDPAAVDSQVEVVRSNRVAADVVEKLDL